MRISRSALSAAAVLMSLGLVAACSGDDLVSDPVPAGEVPAGTADGSPAAAGVTASSLAVWTDADLGDLVVDDAEYVLYRFDEDTSDPPVSNCAATCAQNWPPVLAGEGLTFEGDESLLGTVTRPDGGEQVTIGGWPVYRFADDGPQQTLGDGVGTTWHAISPSGAKASDEAGGGDDAWSGSGGGADGTQGSDGTADSDDEDGYSYGGDY